MKGYKINTTLYVFPQTPAVIPNDCGADKIAVQLEDLAAWKEENDALADKIFGYNYNTMTINKKEWADYLNEDIPDKPVLPPPGLAFVYGDLQVEHWGFCSNSEAEEVTCNIDFLNPHDVDVTFSTSDNTKAYIEDGVILVVPNAEGDVTLTAVFEGDDNYSAQTVTLKLTLSNEIMINFLYDETTLSLVPEAAEYCDFMQLEQGQFKQEADSSVIDVTYESPTYTVQATDYDNEVQLTFAGYGSINDNTYLIIEFGENYPALVEVSSDTASYAGITFNAVGQGDTVKVHADTNENPLTNFDGADTLFATTIENNNTFAYDTLTFKGNPVNFSVSYTTVGESTPELTGLKFVDTDESKDMFAIDLVDDSYELTVYNEYYGDFIFSTTQYAINFAADYSELIANYEDIDTANGNQRVFLTPLSDTFLDDYTMTVEETLSGDPVTVGDTGTDFMMPAVAVTVTITENVVPENKMYFDDPDDPDSDIILELVDDNLLDLPADISLALKTNAATQGESNVVFGYDVYRGDRQVNNVQAEPDIDNTYIERIEIADLLNFVNIIIQYADEQEIFQLDPRVSSGGSFGTYTFVKKTIVP